MNWPVTPFDPELDADFHVRRPVLPSQPPQGRATDNPLNQMDPAGLRCLLGMVFEQREAAELLRVATGCTDAMTLRPGALVDHLGRLAQTDARVGRLLEQSLACRLFAAAVPFADMPLCTMALLWATRRHTLDGMTIAALLWLTIRSAAPCRQHFAQRLLQDIRWLGARAVGVR